MGSVYSVWNIYCISYLLNTSRELKIWELKSCTHLIKGNEINLVFRILILSLLDLRIFWAHNWIQSIAISVDTCSPCLKKTIAFYASVTTFRLLPLELLPIWQLVVLNEVISFGFLWLVDSFLTIRVCLFLMMILWISNLLQVTELNCLFLVALLHIQQKISCLSFKHILLFLVSSIRS